jgi:uncharacterized protein
MADERGYSERYGAWALIAGGSDGLGAALAHELAARGLNCLLVARRVAVLDALAADLRATHGVEVLTLPLDLSVPDAAAQLEAATATLDLGIVVFNAGAEASGRHFVDMPFVDWLPTLQRNIIGLTDALHRFATRFRAQGRGGIVIVGSEAAFGGAARGALYTASKGYSLNLGESLWAELAPYGVDVLTLLFRISDTPMLRSVLARKDIPVEATGATPPAEIARATIAALPHGPVLNFDEATSPTGANLTSGAVRRENVRRVSAGMEGFYG